MKKLFFRQLLELGDYYQLVSPQIQHALVE